MSNKILWIDDDIHRSFLRPYVDELIENQYSIIKVNNVDDIDDTINKEEGSISLIIVDIAMPPGKKIDLRLAGGGLRTGKMILEQLEKDNIVKNVPKVVFTNVDDDIVKNYCKNKNIPYLKKEDFFADELVKILSQIISSKFLKSNPYA